MNYAIKKKRKFTLMDTIQKCEFETKRGPGNLYAVKFVIESI